MTEVVVIGIVVLVAVFALESLGAVTGQFDNMQNFQQFSVNSATPKIIVFAQAIAAHENVDPAHNNPCAITPPGWTGPRFGAGIAIYSTIEEGWMRAYFELWLIATGQSSVYSLSDSISTMAHKWTTTQPDGWANDVANGVGLTIDSTLQQALV